jgi:hypothetical protein
MQGYVLHHSRSSPAGWLTARGRAAAAAAARGPGGRGRRPTMMTRRPRLRADALTTGAVVLSVLSICRLNCASTDDPHRSGRPAGVDSELDCGLRKLAHAFSIAVAGRRSSDDRQAIFDALQLSTLCGEPPPSPRSSAAAPSPPTFAPSTTVFVDPEAGSDLTGTGARSSPVRSLTFALLRSRQLRQRSSSGQHVTIALQPGTYYLSAPLVLVPQDSNLTITSAGSGPELPVISGGLLLNTSHWTPHNVTAGANIWATSLKGQLLPGRAMDGLRLGGRRMTRARYPNSDPEFVSTPALSHAATVCMCVCMCVCVYVCVWHCS